MKTAMRRVAGKLADTVREMHEAQRLMLVLQTATDRYVENPGAAARAARSQADPENPARLAASLSWKPVVASMRPGHAGSRPSAVSHSRSAFAGSTAYQATPA
jgi:hypothetical protein